MIGLYNMSSLGLRAFTGVTVGLLGSLIGIHWSLALSRDGAAQRDDCACRAGDALALSAAASATAAGSLTTNSLPRPTPSL